MPPETVLHVVCAWCGRHIRDVDGDGQTGVSHGICPECAASLRATGKGTGEVGTVVKSKQMEASDAR